MWTFGADRYINICSDTYNESYMKQVVEFYGKDELWFTT